MRENLLHSKGQAVLCFAVISAAIYLLLWHLSRSTAALPQANLIGMSAACDLLLTVPLLYYGLLVRPGYSSFAALSAIVLAGARTAALLFPGDAQGWHATVRWISIPLELSMIVAVVHRLRHIDPGMDVATRLRAASGAIVRNRWMSEIVAAELEISQPMLVGESALVLRLGLLWRVEIPREAILVCRWIGHTFEPPRQEGDLSLVKINQPQWVIELKQPIMAKGPYGLRRRMTCIGFAVDDAAGFEAAMSSRIVA